MAFRKPVSIALSAVALAGFTALATGAATSASAQTVSHTSEQAVATRLCDWRFGNCQYVVPQPVQTWQVPVQTWQQPVQTWQVPTRPWHHHHHHGWFPRGHHHHHGWGA